MIVFFKPISSEVFYLFLFLNCAAFAATYMEELERGELHFGQLGSLEGLVIAVLFFVSWLFAPLREFWRRPIVDGYPAYWLIIVLFCLGCAGTAAGSTWRAGRVPRPFVLFVATLAGLIYLFYTMEVDRLTAWLIVTLYGGDYIGLMMRSHLLSKRHKYPDLIIFICLLLGGGLVLFGVASQAVLIWLIFFMIIYLILKAAAVSGLLVWRLRDHWLWVNPVIGD